MIWHVALFSSWQVHEDHDSNAKPIQGMYAACLIGEFAMSEKREASLETSIPSLKFSFLHCHLLILYPILLPALYTQYMYMSIFKAKDPRYQW